MSRTASTRWLLKHAPENLLKREGELLRFEPEVALRVFVDTLAAKLKMSATTPEAEVRKQSKLLNGDEAHALPSHDALQCQVAAADFNLVYGQVSAQKTEKN